MSEFSKLSMAVGGLSISQKRRKTSLWCPKAIRSRHQYFLEESRSSLQRSQDEMHVLIPLRNLLSYTIHVSSTSFNQLKCTTICDLDVDVQNLGTYLLLRILEETYFDSISFMTVVEDHKGNVHRFSIYNYTGDDHTKFLDLFSLGSVLILKEPYFKIANDGYPMLRCDCPTDIIILNKSHSLCYIAESIKWKNELASTAETDHAMSEKSIRPKSAIVWKDRGNYLFKRKRFNKSIDAYLMGMQMCDTTDPVWKLLRMNLAAAYLEVEDFEKAADNCQKVLEKFPSEQKALFRAGISCYKLRDYKKALFYFEKLKAAYPNFSEGHTQLKLAKMRVEESDSETFDTQRLQRESDKLSRILIRQCRFSLIQDQLKLLERTLLV